MPDADDFDVEYFRNLLRGNSPKAADTPAATPASPAAASRKPPVAAKAARGKKAAPPTAGKKRVKRP